MNKNKIYGQHIEIVITNNKKKELGRIIDTLINTYYFPFLITFRESINMKFIEEELPNFFKNLSNNNDKEIRYEDIYCIIHCKYYKEGKNIPKCY